MRHVLMVLLALGISLAAPVTAGSSEEASQDKAKADSSGEASKDKAKKAKANSSGEEASMDKADLDGLAPGIRGMLDEEIRQNFLRQQEQLSHEARTQQALNNGRSLRQYTHSRTAAGVPVTFTSIPGSGAQVTIYQGAQHPQYLPGMSKTW
jgi:hypothetical protein